LKYIEIIESSQFRIRLNLDGSKELLINGELYRGDIPAMEWPDGSKRWWVNGKLHREDGPAVEWSGGSKHWYLNGKLHREDGPAVEWPDGSKRWWVNGKLHREDGPAVEWADGSRKWYLNGIKFTLFEYLNKIGLGNIEKVFPLWPGDWEDLKLFIQTGLFSEKEIENIIKTGEPA
jgi:hypothetical protein